MTKEELEAKVKELEEKNEELQMAVAEKDAQAEEQKTEAIMPLILPDKSATPMIPYKETKTKQYKLFRDEYRYKRPLYVSINGNNWVIPRGVVVDLPAYVVDFIEQYLAEEAAIWERVEKEEREYRELTAKQV